ncbi:MAG: 50S ribosomal protein L11 methyltransferase [Dongiaceae bacterium]
MDDLVSTGQSHSYSINGTPIDLAIPPGVFVPSTYTLSLAGLVRINANESVADIGTGSGILAILAAKLGAKAAATDINHRAVAAARRNGELNQVTLDVGHGDLFADFAGPFDVIIANLPQARIEPRILPSIDPHMRTAIDGGPGGNAVLCRFLQACRRHMHGGTRIYVSVDTETDYRDSFTRMLADFNVRLLGVHVHALYDAINDAADIYRRLSETGQACVFQQNGRLHGLQFVVELTAK